MLPRSSSSLLRLASFAGAAALSLVVTGAFAQEPARPALPQLPAAEPAPATVAGTPLAPVSPASEDLLTVEGGYTCLVGEHAGVERDDARTTADVLCHALAAHGARPGVYDIRLGKLGGKLLLVLTERATHGERRLFLQGVEEVPVASERLVVALTEDKPIEQTQTVENVVSSESPTPKQKKVQAGVILGLTGQSAIGAPNTTSGGIEIDMQFRLKNFALLGEGRLGGIGSSDNKMVYESLGVGGRYFLGEGDVAPFVGAGFMFANFQLNQSGFAPALEGSGFGGYGELGMAFMRSSRVGGVINLRADLPMFSLVQSGSDLHPDPSPTDYSTSSTTSYVVPISINAGLSFQ